MKLIIDAPNRTVTVYGDYTLEDVVAEVELSGLESNEWTIAIIPDNYWNQSISYPSFFNFYEIKA